MSPKLRILLVDDEPPFRLALQDSFEIAGLEIDAVSDGPAALRSLSDAHGVIVTDLRMPRMDGLQLLKTVHDKDPDLPVILMTGHGDIPTAVRALQEGAFDFLSKPFATDHMVASVRRALETRALVLENRRLRELTREADSNPTLPSPALLGDTPVMARLRQTIRQLAAVDVDVLVEGELGTGKEAVARYLHRLSPRRSRPFVAVECAALPAAIAEETLFGGRTHRGRIVEADRGVLFLGEIDRLPPEIQVRLLPVIEAREIPAAFGAAPRTVDVRLIAAMSGDAEVAVAEGRFRADLYYRLETVRLRMPPLRERRADLPLLFSVFLEEAASHLGRSRPPLDATTASRLAGYDWPGNIRELQNFAARQVLGLGTENPQSELPLAARMDQFEAAVMRETLGRLDGDVTEAARSLGLPKRSLYARLQRLGIEPSTFRRRGA